MLPFSPDLRGNHGGARATAAILEMLSRDHSVRAIYLETTDDPRPRQLPSCEQLIAVPVHRTRATRRSIVQRVIEALARLAGRDPRWVEEAWSLDMANKAAELATEFRPDVIHYEFHVMAQYIPVLRSAWPQAAVVVTEHEPGITADAVQGTAATLRHRLRAWARRRAWSSYERRTLPLADAIVVFTRKDAAAVKHLFGPAAPPIAVIPFRMPGQSALPIPATAAIKSDFVFVGNFRHPPNADAARRLVESIFPMILRELPQATLTIVGADPPPDVVGAASDRVTVTGWVDDPSIYLAGAAVVLVPLRQGGGLRVKMLEACGAGKAIVASPMAIEGLSLKHDEEVRIAETDSEFAASAVALIADSESRASLERASRRWWEGEHDLGRWSAQYDELYASLRKGP